MKVMIFSSIAGTLAGAIVMGIVYNNIMAYSPAAGISAGFGLVVFFIVFNTFMLAAHLKNKP